MIRELAIGAMNLAPELGSPTMETSSTCFSCMRLNDTTFLIVEDDKWAEYPFIYAKLYASVLVLIDTGCGGTPRDATAKVICLRTFLETYPVADNDHQPLNPDSSKDYIVICSHCHFDHIGKVAALTASFTYTSSSRRHCPIRRRRQFGYLGKLI